MSISFEKQRNVLWSMKKGCWLFDFYISYSLILTALSFLSRFLFFLFYFVLFFVVLPPFWEGVVIIRVVAL